MKYYQLFYNASECGLSGTPGFGVRTVTEGIPQEYIEAILADESLLTYQSGEFDIRPGDILSNPERIVEFPKSFYYKKLQLSDGREIYVVGRIVSACFDFPFYHSGTMTRPGNFINHIYLFDQKPDAEVFDLLFEAPAGASASFLPKDWSPRTDNPEMTALMLGKPEKLAPEEKVFRSVHSGICEKAFTLYFQYLELRKNNKPIVVKAQAAETGDIIAGFMRLLPAKLAGDVTFVTNFQDNGLAKGVKMTFVNEYYSYQVFTTTCDYLDLTAARPAPTALEKVYRESLESTDGLGEDAMKAALSEWICSDTAARNVAKSKEFSLALFNYVHRPELFNYEGFVAQDGLIGELARLIGHDENKAALLNKVLSERFSASGTVAEFKEIIDWTEKCRNASIPVDSAIRISQQEMTGKALAGMKSLYGYLSTLGEANFNRYMDRAELPVLKDALLPIIQADLGTEEKKALMKYLEPDAKKRVALYVDAIRRNPKSVGLFQPYLEWDKTEADNVDWLKELKDSFGVDEIAPLLFNQLRYHPKGQKEQLSLYADLAGKNAAFKSLVKKNAGAIYPAACTWFESNTRPAEFGETLGVIQEKVLPFIQDDKTVSRHFDRLIRVMKGDVGDVQNIGDYWDLAVKMKARDTQQKLMPACFRSFEDKDSIYGFVDTVLSNGLLDKEEIIDNVVKHTKSMHPRIYFWRALKRFGGYAGYDSIHELGRRLNIPEQDMNAVFAQKFKAEYKAHKREVFKKNLKKFLKKKPVWISALVLLLAVAALVFFLVRGGKTGGGADGSNGASIDTTAVSSRDSLNDAAVVSPNKEATLESAENQASQENNKE